MPMRVTFDTNVLDLACRPERFPKDPRQPLMYKVRKAIVGGQIQGFYPVTMLTIEGIMRKDRANVYAGTQVVGSHHERLVGPADVPDEIRALLGDEPFEAHTLKLTVEQPARQPLHPEVQARMKAAKALGFRVLRDVPRLGAFQITDPNKEYYLDAGEGDALGAWIARCHAIGREIEARGCGMAPLKAVGVQLAADPETIWWEALDKAADAQERNAIERAFSEWADGDAIASHIAYGIEYFCSADVGKSSSGASILSPENRTWLTETYGVTFLSFEDLASRLS